MSTTPNRLKAAATGQPAGTDVATTEARPKDLAHLLASPAVKAQIALALPKHMTAERMARIATTEVRRIPKLAKAEPMSFLGAVIQCAQLGLEPGNALGHVYLLPFDRNVKEGREWRKVTEAQVIIGYRGMIELARRSGQIESLEARAVFEGDVFDCELGLDSKLVHKPAWNTPDRDKPEHLRFVYAVAKLKGGGVQFDVMSRVEVERVMQRSQGYRMAKDKLDKGERADNPWLSDFVPMALKTVIRRLFKMLPVSIEIATAIDLDERAEQGRGQHFENVIDGQTSIVDDDEPPHDDEPTGEVPPPPPPPEPAPPPRSKRTPAPPPEPAKEAEATTPTPAQAPAPAAPADILGWIEDVDNAPNPEAAKAIADRAKRELPPEQADEVQAAYVRAWT